jgi:hypothetical protein
MSLIKIVVLLSMSLFLVACTTKNVKPHDLSNLAIIKSIPVIACKTPRPVMCTREYRPVCGLKNNESEAKSATYANSCEACADVNVKGYQSGSCDADPASKTGMLNKTFSY